MDTKKDFIQEFHAIFGNTFDNNLEIMWQWHIDQMRELAEIFRREEIGCNVVGRYDRENNIIRDINTKVDLVIKEMK